MTQKKLTTMTQYDVHFKEPIEYTYKDEVFNKETKRWEVVEITDAKDHFTFYSVAPAKKLIKAHFDKYAYSSVVKIYANGDWIPCGEIKITGSNKHFIANSGMTKSNY